MYIFLSIGAGRLRGVVGIAGDEPLLERLRVLVQDTTTDNHVKRKAVELFGTWSVNYRNEKGMERLAGLRSQLPTKVTIPFLTRKKVPELTLLLETCCTPSSSSDPRRRTFKSRPTSLHTNISPQTVPSRPIQSPPALVSQKVQIQRRLFLRPLPSLLQAHKL